MHAQFGSFVYRERCRVDFNVNGKDGGWNVRAVAIECSLFMLLRNPYDCISTLHLEEDFSLH